MLKVRKAARASVRLLAEPLDFPNCIALADATSDTWLVHRIYFTLARSVAPGHRARLEALQTTPIDLGHLSTLPARTFGRQFAAFCARNHITPGGQLEVEPTLKIPFERNWAMARFVRVHDFHHLLLGFETDPIGESALQAFNFVNFRDPFGLFGLAATPLTMRAYGQPLRTLRATALATEIGRRSPNLLWHPYEEWWGEELDAVRARVGLPGALVSRVEQLRSPPSES